MTIEASERDEVSASRFPGRRRVASGRVALVFTSANGKIIVERGIKDRVVKIGPLYISTRCIHVKARIASLSHCKSMRHIEPLVSAATYHIFELGPAHHLPTLYDAAGSDLPVRVKEAHS